MQRKLSVIVPVYKTEAYLVQCVDSIVNQTFQDMEIILVDDGSPDSCGAICDRYAASNSSVKAIHKENGGLSDARNKGLEIACGQYVAFVDSDDWLETDFFEKLFLSMGTSQPDIYIAGGYVKEINGKIRTIESCRESAFFDNKEQIDFVTARTLVPLRYQKRTYGFIGVAWNKLYKWSFLKDNDLLFSVDVRAWEDSWFNLHAFSMAKQIGECTYIGYHYRMLSDSISHGFDPLRPEKDDAYMRKLYGCLKNDTLGTWCKQAIYLAIITVASEDLRLFYLHPSNQKSKREITREIKYLKDKSYVREAICNNSNMGIDKKRLVVKYMMRLPFIWPMRLAYKIYQKLSGIEFRQSAI